MNTDVIAIHRLDIMPRGRGKNRRSGGGGRGRGGRGGKSRSKKKADVDDAAIISPTNQLQLSPPRNNRSTAANKRTATFDIPVDTTPSRLPQSSRLKLSGGTITDIKVVDVKYVEGGKDKKEYYTCMYKLFLNNCSLTTMKVSSGKTAWVDEDPPSCMMNKIRTKILEKKEALNIDMDDVSVRVLMDSTWPWSLLWDSFMNEVHQHKLAAIKKSKESYMGHETRTYAIATKEWEKGGAYDNSATQSFAKQQLLAELEKRSGKQLGKAVVLLSSIVSDLREEGLNELDIISTQMKERFKMIDSMVNTARAAINGLRKNFNKASARILTGFCAIIAPTTKINGYNLTLFCEVFGISRQSKYMIQGILNRKEYDGYLEIDRPLAIGDRVSCKGSNDATIIALTPPTVTVQLHPTETVKTYGSLKKGNVLQFQPALDEYQRVERSDKSSEVDMALMRSFWIRNNQRSPNKKDTIKVRHPVYPTMYEERTIIYCYTTDGEQWDAFGRDHPDVHERYKNAKQPHTAPRIFRECKPAEMKKGKDAGCLCIKCEGFQGLFRGASQACTKIDEVITRLDAHKSGPSGSIVTRATSLLEKISEILSSPSKYQAIVSCLHPCLKSDDKLESAKYSCINNKCERCGFRRLWLPLQEMLEEHGNILDGNEWVGDKSINWWQYTHQVEPSAASHSQNMARLAAAARAAARQNIDADDEEYNEKTGSRNLILEPTSGSLLEYLIRFRTVSEDNTNHRHLVATEAAAKVKYDQNVRPLIVTRTIDFSENGTIKDKRQVQSQYWQTIGYTVFMSILEWLLASEWDKESGQLKVGDEVTVYGEKSGEPVNTHSFWAKVTDVIGADTYVLEDNSGKEYQVGEERTIKRRHLRHRVKYTIAVGHISDDKSHDSQAMQHYTNKELKWLEQHMKDKFPQDIPAGKILRLHTKSDNAASHFKNTRQMNYITTLSEDRGGSREAAFVYSFGAPSHGKGFHDGVGGVYKYTVDGACSRAYAEGVLEYTASGYVMNVRDVYDVLVHYYEEEGNRDRRSGANSVDAHKFFLTEIATDPIERPESTYKTMDGISEHYQFVSRSRGSLFKRRRVCYCVHCMAEFMNGFNGWVTDTHTVSGCEMVLYGDEDVAVVDEDTAAGEEDDGDGDDGEDDTSTSSAVPNLYRFDQGHAIQLSGPNMLQQRAADRRSRNQMARELVVGDFVLNDSTDPNQPLWLGRVMSNPEWDGAGKQTNNSNRVVRYKDDFNETITVNPEETALYIIWYERIDVNSRELNYHISRTLVKPFVQSNYYFVHGGFDMHCTTRGGGGNPVPKERSTTRGGRRRSATTSTTSLGDYARPRQDNQTSFEAWHDKEYGLVWKMDHSTYELALSRVGEYE